MMNQTLWVWLFNNKKFYIQKGIVIKYEKEFKIEKLKALNPLPFRSKDFITLDIETLNIDNKLIPYAIGFYDGKNFIYNYGINNIINWLP
jgi:hypothetical protein